MNSQKRSPSRSFRTNTGDSQGVILSHILFLILMSFPMTLNIADDCQIIDYWFSSILDQFGRNVVNSSHFTTFWWLFLLHCLMILDYILHRGHVCYGSCTGLSFTLSISSSCPSMREIPTLPWTMITRWVVRSITMCSIFFTRMSFISE